MSIDYGEIVCTAIDEIVTAKLQGLQYDITKLCTVIDDTYSYQGRYTVSDGTARYEAFSENTGFKNGNNVLVVIPNGDYTLQKTITGRVAAADTTPFNYTSPMDTMIRITNNVFDNSNTIYGDNAGLVANAGGKTNGTIIGPLYSLTESADFAGFTRLGITADFRSWLTGLDVVSGMYGLKVLVYTEVPNTPGGMNDNAVYELTFSSADMIGNPYQFESYFSQEKVFDISNITNIKQIDVYFYQNGQFKDGQKESIPWYDTDDILGPYDKPNNLFVDNVKIYLGYEKGAFIEDTLMLYTNDSMSYHYSHENLWKDISLRWIHKVRDNEFTLLNPIDIDGNNYEVHWFKYHPGWENINQYAGKDWKEIECINGNPMQCSFLPDVKKRNEQVKAIGLIKEIQEIIKNNEAETIETVTPYYSNLFIFENEEYVPDDITVDAATALSIVCMDRTEGNYYLYNQNGKINNEGIGQGYKRYFKAMYQGAEITSSLGKLDWIKWLIPTNSTMLIVTDEYVSENSGKVTNTLVRYKGVNYKEITRKVADESTELTSTQQAFSVANIWNQQESNNTVMCQVSINGVIYEAVAELRFGKSGTNGTTTTFLIEFADNQNALVAKNKKTVTVGARLYDSDNSRVDFTDNELKNINWSWFKSTANKDYITIPSDANGKQFINLICNIDGIPDDNYYILQAEYNGLVAYLPIPLKTAETDFIEGAREIIYNHQGVPNYYTGPYVLYYTENGEYKEGVPGVWDISCDELIQSVEEVDVTKNGYVPSLKLSSARPGYKALCASPFYASGKNDKVCVYYKDVNNNKYGWSQPILIMQSKYDFAMLNEWDGSLTIDENNGTILSTMLGAGRKNDNNTFSGVLIGDISSGTENNEASTQTGVYGLHEGVISYALKEDGTATFGKAGHGQIKIDGNKGQIFSPNYFNKDENGEKDIGEGMLIDLDDGKIHIKDNGSTKILIQPDSLKDPYLLVNGKNNATLINIQDENYYLQSSDYYMNEGRTGTYFDLADGELIIKKPEAGAVYLSDKEGNLFKVQTKDNQPLIVMRNEEYYLQSALYEGKKQHTIKYNNETYALYNNTRTSLLNGDKTISITPIVALKGNEVYQITEGVNDKKEKTYTPSEKYISFLDTTIKRTEAKDENENDVDVVSITYTSDQYKNYFISQLSPKLINTSKSGLKMDLKQGYISGYDLRLNGINADNDSQQFILDSSAEKTPFSVGNKFKVDWDGTVYCENIKYLGTKPADGTTVININDNFYVTSSGGTGGSSASFGTGYFGGGYFGGSAARVALGDGSGNFALVDSTGKIYQSNESSDAIFNLRDDLADVISMAQGTENYILEYVVPMRAWYASSEGIPTKSAIAIQAEAQLALKKANEALAEAEAAMTKAKAAYDLADSLAPPGVG